MDDCFENQMYQRNLIENDKYNPSLELCLSLAHVLGTDLNSLFWDGDEQQ